MATETAQSNQSTEKKTDEPRIEVKEEATSAPEVEPKAEAKVEPNAGPKTEGTSRSSAAPKSPEPVSRVGRADAVIRRNVLWVLGAGLVPVPIVDMVAITGIQVKMLAELSELYDLSFREDIARKLIGSLLSGVLGVGAGAVIGASLGKLIPFVGHAFGIVTVPVISGAFTRALGKVFVMHFETGGTLLDFDPHKVRSYFKQEFENAKEYVADVQKSKEDSKATKPS
ncbi:YcjF family protein [Polyangium jinanense]|uniref:DUF697 domain-containing protein n=1 Tax=Polyangium jinanense TaxID=2829994 RepID=A0A9X3XG73_9BACT|nr:DUF697 domain-containing protein [Polyangium jinanense]MDC3961001.1 DUF697 domain-containing protein [Polyangium jinanense]MDC3987421.1 DUF697 domain-containing protein [Polyangium jinanense]